MTTFSFQVIDEEGNIIADQIDANSKIEAYNKLSSTYNLIIDIQEQSNSLKLVNLLYKDINIFPSVHLKWQVNFLMSINSMLSAGLTIENAIKILEESALGKENQSKYKSLRESIRNGRSFSQALIATDLKFDGLTIALIKTGEKTGKLNECIRYSFLILNNKLTNRNLFIELLTYPAILICFASLIFIFIFTNVIPQLLPLIQNNEAANSFGNSIIILISNTLINHGSHLFLIMSTLLLLATIIYFYSNTFKTFISLIATKLPFLGEINKYSNEIFIYSILNITMKSGITLEKSLTLIIDNISSSIYKENLVKMNIKIREGENIGKQFIAYSELYSVDAAMIIEIGNNTSNLSESFSQAASIVKEKLSKKKKFITHLLPPIILLIIGALTAFILYTIWSVIFTLNNSISL